MTKRFERIPNNMGKKNICIYIRESKGSESGLKRQEDILTTELAKKYFGDSNIKVFKDSCGCINTDRKGLKELLEFIKYNATQYILVTHSNRIYRVYNEKGLEELIKIRNQILPNGTGIISYDEEMIMESDGNSYPLCHKFRDFKKVKTVWKTSI